MDETPIKNLASREEELPTLAIPTAEDVNTYPLASTMQREQEDGFLYHASNASGSRDTDGTHEAVDDHHGIAEHVPSNNAPVLSVPMPSFNDNYNHHTSTVMSSIPTVSSSLNFPPRHKPSVNGRGDGSNSSSAPPATALSLLQRRPVAKGRTVSWGDRQQSDSLKHETVEQTILEQQRQSRAQFQATSNNASQNLNAYDEKTQLPSNRAGDQSRSNDSMFSSPFLYLDEVIDFDSRKQSPISNMSRARSARSSLNSIDLNDVLRASPLETEAETLILQAIEARDNAALNQINRQRTGTATSLLSNVTEDGAFVFTAPTTAYPFERVESQDDSLHSKNNRDLDPIVDLQKGHKCIDPNESSYSTGNINQDTRPKKVSRATTIGTAGTGNASRSPRHRRDKTMEQTLAGLAEAIAEIKVSKTDSSNTAGKDRNFQHPKENVLLDEGSMGIAETLAHNANLIYRGNKKKDNNPSHSPHLGPQSESSANQPSESPKVSSGSATYHWGKVQQAVKSSGLQIANNGPLDCSGQRKKTDNESTTAVDERIGDVNSVDLENGMSSSLKKLPETLTIEENNNGSQRNTGYLSCFYSCVSKPCLAIKDFRIFMREQKEKSVVYLRLMLLLFFPAAGIASILFYFADNPPTGRVDLIATERNNGTLTNHKGESIDPDQASASWWILFICVRQATTFALASVLQVLIIDFLCLSTRSMVNAFGNMITLFIVQSRGWPFTLCMWALLDLGLLYGSYPFASHWLYWQDVIGIFNEENPSGRITSNAWNRSLLLVSVSLSVVVAIKRLWLGLFLGRKTYANYAEELAKVMKKILCLCEVAALARDIQWETDNGNKKRSTIVGFGMSKEKFDGLIQRTADLFDDDDSKTEAIGGSVIGGSDYHSGLLIDPNDIDRHTGALSSTQRMKIVELLGAWEGPEEEMGVEENPSISAILQFRHSLSLIDNRFMFSIAWGDVTWRDRMVISSQDVYRKLLLRSPDPDSLSIDILALAAGRADGSLDQEKLKDLIRLFRPDRDGNLTLLDFVKSVDTVYKEAKLLRASVKNSEKIDRAFERTTNILFYIVVGCVILSQLGYDPLTLFLALSPVIVAFTFIIGSASAKMFEGFLLILMRRPYDIGDRIHVSNTEAETNPDGSLGWIVKDVDLFTTTVIFAPTNERATLSNGSLAGSRVINLARSKKAIVSVYNKFSTDVAFEKVQIFEEALRKFVKARPREWANFVAFRATKVVADLGFIEYITILQHRDSWQNTPTILSSKAQVATFCLELSKKLNMRYVSPPLPVDLAIRGTNDRSNTQDANSVTSKLDLPTAADEVVSMFAIH